MKGLLMKDLYFTLQQKKMFFIILFMFFIFYVSQGVESGSFTISYVTLLGGMFVLTTISYDEFDNSLSYLLTMPIKREDYVREKYLFGAVGTMGFWAVVTIAYVFLDFQNAGENLLMSSIILVVMLIFEMIMLPVQLKYGGDKGRIVLVGIVAGGFLLASLGKKLLSYLIKENPQVQTKLHDILEKASDMQPWMFVVVGGILLVLVGCISYKSSVKIIRNREY